MRSRPSVGADGHGTAPTFARGQPQRPERRGEPQHTEPVAGRQARGVPDQAQWRDPVVPAAGDLGRACGQPSSACSIRCAGTRRTNCQGSRAVPVHSPHRRRQVKSRPLPATLRASLARRLAPCLAQARDRRRWESTHVKPKVSNTSPLRCREGVRMRRAASQRQRPHVRAI
jgi:hypothetical protein